MMDGALDRSDEEVGRYIKEALRAYIDGGPDKTLECLALGGRAGLDWVADKVEKARELRGERELEQQARLEPGKIAKPLTVHGVEPRPPPALKRITLEPNAPFDSARIFAATHRADGTGTLWCYQGQMYRWNGTHYRPIDDGLIRADLYAFLDQAVTLRDGEWVRFRPDANKVSKVLDALRAAVVLPNDVIAPAWLEGKAPVENATELLACQNGLLHLPTRKLHPHTPRFWSHNALDFEFEPEAPCPRWIQFIAEVWPEDDEAVATLQEIFGLCLTDETRFQKAFMLIGPKRSGKGTIGRVLRGLVGANNYVGPTLNGLTSQFGLQSFIGKKVAVFSDARLDARANSSVISERLLSITGEDVLDVDRKYLPAWGGILGTRILILSNELPAFKDDSGALASRFVLLRIERSFYGKEDTGLTDRLLAERPGILNWALEGWDRLRDRGYFLQPESGREVVEHLATATSSIQAFVEERCELGAEFSIECVKLYTAWCDWSEQNGMRPYLPINHFSAKLTTVVPDVHTFRPRDRDDPKRPRWFAGIRLRSDGE